MAKTEQSAVLTPKPTYTVHDKQREVLASDARYRTCPWGRRGGKNIVAVIDLIEYARNPAASEWGSDSGGVAWWVGPTYTQAKKYGFEKMLAAVPNSWIDGEPKRSEPYEIPFKSGVTVEFRTFDKPESLQGAGVDRMVVDEADYMPRALWDNDLEPMLMDNLGAVLFISKPVRRDYFFEMWQRGLSDDYPDYESFHATSADNPFIAEDPEDKRGTVPDRVFRQEYLAEFVDETGGVFGDLDDLLFTADYSYSQAEGIPYDGEPPYAHGWDLARHEDWAVGHVLDANGDVVHFDRMRGVSWPQIQQRIEQAAIRYEGQVAIDATRDNKLVSDLDAAGLSILPVKFSMQQKTELIDNLVATVESGALGGPDIPPLKHELQIFEYDVKPSGNTQYHAPEGMHDDCVDSLALALHAKTHEPDGPTFESRSGMSARSGSRTRTRGGSGRTRTR